jgi:Zn finger protein HypA/HybF involved in hydrogenase expression
MHELGITRNIVAIVADAANGRRVRCVTLEIGKLSGVMKDAIAFWRGSISRRSKAAPGACPAARSSRHRRFSPLALAVRAN